MNTIPAIPTSIRAYKKYGLNPSMIRFLCTKSWSIANSFLDCFEEYYILHWTKKHFLEKASQGNGYLIRNEGMYEIIYHCTTRGKILAAPENSTIHISFRKPQPEFGIGGFVLVSLPPRT